MPTLTLCTYRKPALNEAWHYLLFIKLSSSSSFCFAHICLCVSHFCLGFVVACPFVQFEHSPDFVLCIYYLFQRVYFLMQMRPQPIRVSPQWLLTTDFHCRTSSVIYASTSNNRTYLLKIYSASILYSRVYPK